MSKILAKYIWHLYSVFYNFVGSAKPPEARGPREYRISVGVVRSALVMWHPRRGWIYNGFKLAPVGHFKFYDEIAPLSSPSSKTRAVLRTAAHKLV